MLQKKGAIKLQDYNNIETYKMQVGNYYDIDLNSVVKVSKQGNNYTEVTYTDLKPKATVRKLDKKHYMVCSTKEVKEYKENDKKGNKSLYSTMKKIRELIRCNFNGSKNEVFLTLTYKENMQDRKKLYNDFKKFYQKLKRKFKEHKFEYIIIAEPQERGAWHLHILLKAVNQKKLYLQQNMLLKMWGHGGVYIERIKDNVDDLGTYFGAYFTDLIDEDSKKRKKGARLHLYPKYFKFYRTSRGIKKPELFYTQYKNICENKEYEKIYVKTYELIGETEIINSEGKVIEKLVRICNIIQKEIWKKMPINKKTTRRLSGTFTLLCKV